jgi:SagB-type dehydrogenase family enzyme
MEFQFSSFFHQYSKNLSAGGARIPADENEWPSEWRTTYYKTYPVENQIKLSPAQPLQLTEKFFHQRSSKRVLSDQLTESELSTILYHSCAEFHPNDNREIRRRPYPSGGARYPIEIYVLALKPGLPFLPGVYHYNCRDHALDTIWETSLEETAPTLFTYDWAHESALAIIMTATFDRTQAKYKERGYRYLLIEAGHIGQNIYLNSAMLGVGCCALGGTRDENIEALLDIDGVTESVIYTLCLGKNS